MTEASIFKILHDISTQDASKDETVDEFSALRPRFVHSVSEAISNIIYNNLKDNSSSTSKRLDFIQLIRKWCPRELAHYQVNDSNCECLLKCLKLRDDEITNNGNAMDEFLFNLSAISCKGVQDFDDTTEFVETMCARISKRTQLSESIKCLDREQLKDINFSVHSENVDTSLIRQRLCNIFDNKCNEFEASSTCNFNTHETRKSRIGFVYALLNLPASNSNEVLITKNIEIIADQENKTGEEMQLLDYIFRNEGNFSLDVKFHLKMLNKHRYTLEIPVIKLCTSVLKAKTSQEKMNILQEFKQVYSKIYKISVENSSIKFEIINILLTLFSLSNYREDMLLILKHF